MIKARQPEDEMLGRLILLTAREAEVLALLGHGLKCPEIATHLRRGKRTIETHIRNISRKTGVVGVQRLTRLALIAERSRAGHGVGADGTTVAELRREIAMHHRSRQALEQVASATDSVTGERFLEALASSLCAALDVRAAAVVERLDAHPERLCTVAFFADGAFQPPLEMAPSDSCLADPDLHGLRLVESDAVARCPADPLVQRLEADCCLGIPLLDGECSLIGGVLLLHDRAIDERRSPELVVRLFAGRVAAELERRAVERRLRESETCHRALAEHASDVISRFSPTGVHLYVSPAVRTVLGHEPEALVGRSGYEIVHPEDISRVGPVHHAALHDPTPRRVRFRGIRADGSLVWLESIVRGIVDPATGEVHELLAVTRDVSAEQEALEALDRTNAELEARVAERTAELAASEERWRSTVQCASDYICLLDCELRITFINRTLPDVAEADVLGTHVAGHIAPECREATLAALCQVLATGACAAHETETLTPTGRRWWSARYSPITIDGEIVGISVIGRDVTEVRALEHAVRESEARYRRLVELSPDGVLVHDGDRIRFANRTVAAMLGYPDADSMVGLPVLDLVAPECRKQVKTRIAQILKRRDVTPLRRQTLVRRDGARERVDVTGTWCLWDGIPCVHAQFRLAPPEG